MADKKGGIWGAIRSAVVDDIPDKVVPVPVSAPVPSPVPSHPSLAPVKANVDQASRQRLEQALLEAAPPGYSDLNDTISTLSESIPDEGSRFRAALKLASKRGHSVDNLLGDVDKCIGILENKSREFQDEIKSQIQRKVGSKQKSVESLDGLIQTKKDQINSLQSEIGQLMGQRATDAASIETENARIQAVAEGFEGAYDASMAVLIDRRKKIEIYGKGGAS